MTLSIFSDFWQFCQNLRWILIDIQATIEKSDISLIGSVIYLMYQNEILQETCDC